MFGTVLLFYYCNVLLFMLMADFLCVLNLVIVALTLQFVVISF